MLRTGRLRTPMGLSLHFDTGLSINARSPRSRGLWRLPGPDSHRLDALSLSPDLHQTSFSSDVSDYWTYTSAHRQRFAQEEGSQQRGVAAWLPA